MIKLAYFRTTDSIASHLTGAGVGSLEVNPTPLNDVVEREREKERRKREKEKKIEKEREKKGK